MKDWLDHIAAMFGVSWDRVLVGLVYALASWWFWWAFANLDDPHAPLDGVRTLLETLTITPPGWIEGVASWMGHPQRAGLIVVAAVGAGLAATIYAGTQSAGAEVSCVVLALVAFQGIGRAALVPMFVTLLLPVALSILLAVAQRRSRGSRDERPLESALGEHTASLTLLGALSSLIPFAAVPFFPLVAVGVLTRCYRSDRSTEETGELSQQAPDRLWSGSAADRRAALQALVVTGALLSDPHDQRSRQQTAGMLNATLNVATGAIPLTPPPRL